MTNETIATPTVIPTLVASSEAANAAMTIQYLDNPTTTIESLATPTTTDTSIALDTPGTCHPTDEAGESFDASSDASLGVLGDAVSSEEELRIHEDAALIPPMSDDEYHTLVEDIRSRGLIHAIVVFEGQVLDGCARYRACREAGVTPRFVRLSAETDPVSYVASANVMRRHLTVDQRAALAVVLLPHLEKEAARRRLAAIGQADGSEAQTDEAQTEKTKKGAAKANEGGRAREQAAAMFGISGRTVQTAKAIAAADRELLESLKAGTIKLAEAKRQVAANKRAAERHDPGALPEGPFDLIVADPPWRYEVGTMSSSRQIEAHYPTMTMDKLRAMADDIIACSADDAVLLMWATAPLLCQALDLVEAWGYRYQTSMVWIKDKIGTGYWCRNQHEILLIATRGKPAHPETGVRPPSVIHAPRGEHSAKPIEVTLAMEAAFPHARKVELFERGKARDGWCVWGDQTIPSSPDEAQVEIVAEAQDEMVEDEEEVA
jgi:N6-adenosine-specific RNA methylase IME4/ParB-like chromosome segregation protein Spo0J